MLRELHLRDLGVIHEAGVELSPGLNVVTGETGVGKTLLVTSLALLLGARGHARLVRDGAGEAVVSAVVGISETMRAALAQRGVEVEHDVLAENDAEIVLVRRLSSDGRSRAWVGGQLATSSTLADVGELLVEIHGQGAGFALARPAAQLAAVDALAGNAGVLKNYRDALDALRSLDAEGERLRAGEDTREREIELYLHQIDEIERAELEADEEDTIGASMARLEHAERLRELGRLALTLTGAEGASGELAQAHKTLQAAAAIDPTIAEIVDRLAGLAAETAEVSREVRAWSELLEADPALSGLQLERLHERKSLISNLKRKYGNAIDEILSVAEDARARLGESRDADIRIASIDADVAAARTEVDELAAELSKRRHRAGKRLSELVSAELPALALPNAVFEVSLEDTELTKDGGDRVRFGFSSSRGSSTDDIGKIASGGEMSRAMIAITLALAQTHDVPVLVFDEADQGVGGEAALELGRRLSRLGRSHQVLVVSHLPQLAAFADRHIAVRRSGDGVEVEVLDPAQRLAEVSRMLAGLESSERGRAHAGELLELAASERAAAMPANTA